jgi:major vault protein
MNDLEVDRQARLAAVEADQFRQRVEALGGGLDKVVFLPSGSSLNLFDSMQGLLGPGLCNGATGDKGTTVASY